MYNTALYGLLWISSKGIYKYLKDPLTSMHTEIAVVLVQRLQCGDVRRPFHNLIHPLYGPYHFITLGLREDRRTFVLGYFL